MSSYKNESAVFGVVFGTLLIGACFLTRPTYFGERFNILGSILIFTIGMFVIVVPSLRKDDFHHTIPIAISNIWLWAFLAVHSFVNGVSSPYPLYTVINIALTSFGAGAAFSSRVVHDSFFKLLRLLLALFGLSSLITFIMSIGVSINSLYLFNIPSPTYVDTGDLYFPFTLAYDLKDYGFVVFPRALVFFREPGIAQAFYCWAIATTPKVDTPLSASTFILLIVGLASTQSTIGFGLLGVTLALRGILLVRQSRFQMIVSAIALLFAAAMLAKFAIEDEQVGFASKADNDSYFDRKIGIDNGIKTFLDNPFGIGIYSSSRAIGVSDGINLIASLGAIGVPGLFFTAINWYVSIVYASNKKAKLIAILPFIITYITSQPIGDAPFYCIILFYTAYGDKNLHSMKSTM
ncbi:hypothetical protein [Methylosinus sp. LW3]|uniref:hypothetical protein n=1 Tax=Methylosinus sp. LW3 TaxID=107635 RepID=UPI0012F8661A|nr:hypothetical protein [Methylosinus sp. LW3]